MSVPSDRAVVVSTVIDAPPSVVWADVCDISSHVAWMADAEAIRFVTDQTSGVGTRFECDTRVGPFRLTDVMEITTWVDEQQMGVRHDGLITGVGEFTLRAHDGGTEFTWSEDLVFPWYFGGPVGAWVARPVLAWVWRRNLRRLEERFERT